MSEWISTHERPPEENGEYLAYPGWFNKPYPHYFVCKHSWWGHHSVTSWKPAPVTHWMQLPDPPAPPETEEVK